ncbi:MAG: hypothetical protein KDI90_09600 [Alphaproteobacteria bacterium]|nr:hypothetical protein [Alphaproteobacteria bacterium]MCB9975675.1 hypothetical protein [Rhodospirillales bacterium]
MSNISTETVKKEQLRPIIGSLYYLSQESKRAGYEDVSNAILTTIVRIEDIIRGSQGNICDVVISSDMLKAMAVMNLLSQIPVDRYRDISELLESTEAGAGDF